MQAFPEIPTKRCLLADAERQFLCTHELFNFLGGLHSNGPDNKDSTLQGMKKGANLAIVCTKLLIGLNSKIY